MPELPEVETIRRSLEPLVRNKKIIKVRVGLPRLIKEPEDIETFLDVLEGSKIKSINRRGKYLIFLLDRPWVLVIHLRMTGQLIVQASEQAVEKHTHLIFNLEDQLDLRFRDIRQFGAIYLLPEDKLHLINGLKTLGPEPLAADFTLECFLDGLQGRKQQVKAFLLNQKCVAGIGNIYADEILFQAGIHPAAKVNNLNEQEIEALWAAIIDRLTAGIEERGTSIRDYRDAFGQIGGFQNQLKVYGRAGELCQQCDQRLVKIKVAGRSSVYCPSCQPLKE